MTSWVTADLHLGHVNIIKYCDRPFASVGEMDAAIIERWNSLVQPDDLVYVLGDFTLKRRAEGYVGRLMGRIVFQPGSHDRWIDEAITKYEDDVWERHRFIPALYELKHRGTYITMCHYAMRSWPRSFHGSLHFYGHSHGRLPDYGRSMDVGVDTNDFYPYRIDDVIRELKEREKTD